MKTSGVTNFFKVAQVKAKQNMPGILTGLGIVGMVTAGVLAVHATPKALRLIEEKRSEERVEKLERIEVVKVAWKCYVPAVATGVLSASCLIGANSMNVRKHAALAAAYKISETALTEYREKVVDAIGEKKETAIREKVAQKQIEKAPVDTREVIITEKGNTLFLEPLSGRYFRSDIEQVRKAANDLNDQIYNGFSGSVTLNDFYTEIGLDTNDVGDLMGWNSENRINLHIVPGMAKNDEPCCVVQHHNPPKYDY